MWNGLLTEFAAELRQLGQVAEVAQCATSELDDTDVPWVPRLGGRAPLSPELDRAARTGKWDRVTLCRPQRGAYGRPDRRGGARAFLPPPASRCSDMAPASRLVWAW